MFRAARIFIASAYLFAAAPVSGQAEAVLGFSPEGAGALVLREADYDRKLDGKRMAARMKRLTLKPHHPGSPQGRRNAEFIAARFRSWGYETGIVTYEVLMPTPRLRSLELLEPRPVSAVLEETPVGEDSTSAPDGQLPPYVAFSPDGDVTAEVVFVNRGLREDYEELERRGIDVKGRIVLARYGGSWRGIKPKLAEEHGAIGAILYSDPVDDGFYQGEVYPAGPFKPSTGVQRGSIIDLPVRPGDPLTPFAPAVSNAKRRPLEEVDVMVGIPTLPISSGDALPILQALAGPVAPVSWRGALPATYRVGPGPAVVRLRVSFDWNLAPIHNVIARLEGGERPDEWVMRGNHHDAWVHGAEDPVAGLVAMMEEARAIGELAADGWRPKRTIVYAAWDGEEPGLFGSVEWVEHHADELRDNLVAYVNTDYNRRGLLQAFGSPSLQAMFTQVTHAVDDPLAGVSLHRRKAAAERLARSADAESAGPAEFALNPLGSGSDFSGFVQHLGIAALDFSFVGDTSGGSYHTGYDTYDHFTKFMDPDLLYTRTLAQVSGRLTLRLADAELLPFRMSAAARSIGTYLDEVTALFVERKESAERHNRLLSDGVFRIAPRPGTYAGEPPRRDVPPDLDFSSLHSSAARVTEAAACFDEAIAGMTGQGRLREPGRIAAANELIMQAERQFLRPEGLPGRPWFRHYISAPGLSTGYDAKTFPSVREAIEDGAWPEAERETAKLAEVLAKFARHIDAACHVMQPPAGAANGT